MYDQDDDVRYKVLDKILTSYISNLYRSKLLILNNYININYYKLCGLCVSVVKQVII